VPHKPIGFAVIVCFALLGLSACGGGGGGGGGGGSGGGSSSHTYVVAAPTQNSAGAGIYVTIVSPVALPASLLTKNGARIVGQAKGPQVCSYTKMVSGGHGRSAVLNGKRVTLKVNGSNPFVSMICSLLKKTPFHGSIGGG
jgi:hypothetical protein